MDAQDLKVGSGAPFNSNDLVQLHYTLTLGGFEENGGQIVDSSRQRGKTFNYNFDTGAVIKGWDIGVKGMKVGGRRRLIIPSELGYGARGAGGAIPPNSTLYFDIELMGVGY